MIRWVFTNFLNNNLFKISFTTEIIPKNVDKMFVNNKINYQKKIAEQNTTAMYEDIVAKNKLIKENNKLFKEWTNTFDKHIIHCHSEKASDPIFINNGIPRHTRISVPRRLDNEFDKFMIDYCKLYSTNVHLLNMKIKKDCNNQEYVEIQVIERSVIKSVS